MSAPTSPSWYDVLGVDPDADPDTIRAAWREAIADLDPGQPRFRTLNQAAEILLDHDRKVEYDAGLNAHSTPENSTPANPTPTPPTRQKWRKERAPKVERDVAISDVSAHEERGVDLQKKTKPQRGSQREPNQQENPTPTPNSAPAPATTTKATTKGTTKSGPPVWLLLVVGILAAALVAAAAWLFTQPSDSAIASSTSDAQSAAEESLTTILAYDYRQMDADQKAADALMTPAYAAKYDALFAQLKANAARIKPVVTAQVLASGVVRSGDDRVQVLVFVNRPTTNAGGQEQVFHDQVVATMVHSGNGWLVDDLQTGGEG